ncbi:alpha-L-rhamnosidase [Arcticibacter pallidicorallinus]|uniref:alpha-L-rhamnosidase n=1 Tax=Arcticibacter pallidicorallinus TaxID=1259464 RepID=A0A2T0UCC7_9SPHI|nr:alpha-L-rhamnosidase [Arcticibacter pallidicorallinus]PRY55590.1 alpha-L-rhamnosidase [Arcticibacter pallidicorallinus]
MQLKVYESLTLKVGLCLMLMLTSLAGRAAGIQLQNLRCEMLTDPLGIDVLNPRLSWEITSPARGLKQSAYRILVASQADKLEEGKADLWDSGKKNSDESQHVVYSGKQLKSKDKAYWKVIVWTNDGSTSSSGISRWSMGLLNPVDWRGRWIGLDRAFKWDDEGQWSRLSARYFRKEFDAKKTIKSASVYIMGMGMYELYINGAAIGNQVLAPVPTDYTKGVKYNVFDVTDCLKSGLNTIGTVLGNGRFYTMRQSYKPYKIKTFGYPKMLLNLELTYTDGTTETITTDDTWKVTADGPIRSNNEYDGEEYDATKEMPGWNRTGFDDTKWLKAEYVQEPGGMYEAQMTPNMRIMSTLKPVSIKYLKPGVYIMDMGQNMAGWIKMRVKGKRGTAVSLRFAETLQKDGELFLENMRDAKVNDLYILKGEGVETWQPSFVYHGFRYVEIKGYPGTPKVEDFEGEVIYDEMKTVGSFETSDRTINQVYNNAYWGILGNYKGMPVDCPQRNERQPWLGDRKTGAYGESFIFNNGRLYAKWLDDIQQAQKADGSIPDVAPAFWRYYGDNTTWPGTYIAVADMLLHQYGDVRSVERHYESMKKWIVYMSERYMEKDLMTKDKYGDWCVPPESKEMIHSRDPKRQTDGVLIATATFYDLLRKMENFASIVNQAEDASRYKVLAERLKVAFNDKFLDKTTFQYGNNTVTANLLPLYYDMVPADVKAKVFNNIEEKILVENKGHISTGVIGTQMLMRGLTENGRSDIAFKIATNRDYPSWGYMVENGATTIWELWNGNTASPKMNSQNHVMLLGDLVVWYYENLAGIKSADRSAFKQMVMKPTLPEGLNYVKSSYYSAYGRVVSNWTRNAKSFNWDVEVPVNTTAVISIPAKSGKDVKESGKSASGSKGVKFIKMEDGRAVFEIGSGQYKFTSNL